MDSGQNMENRLDDMFRDTLREDRCEPPAEIWTRIEAGAFTPAKRFPWRWKAAVAAVAVVVIGLGGWFMKPSPQRSGFPSDLIHLPVSAYLADSGEEMFCRELSPVTGPDSGKSVRTVRMDASRDSVFPTLRSRNGRDYLRTATIPGLAAMQTPAIIPLVDGDAYLTNVRYREMLAAEGTEGSGEMTGKQRYSFALGGHLVPSYASGHYSSAVKDALSYRYSEDRLGGMETLGGGLRLSVSSGKRFVLRTGIFYTGLGQQSTTSTSGRYSGAMLQVPEGRRVATPLGNIRLRNRSIRDLPAAKAPFSYQSDEKVVQHFGMLEIPLGMRYDLVQKKCSLFVSGGLSGGIVIRNRVVLENSRGKEWIGRTRDIRKFNISTDFSVGMEYALGRKMSFVIEPGVRYYPQSLSKNSDITFRPLLFSLSTGLGIRL